MATLFIPGIKGTELVDPNAPGHPTLWPAPDGLPGNMVDDPQAFALEVGSHAHGTTALQPGRVISRIAAPLLHALRAQRAPAPVLTFGYDWRRPLEHSARQLLTFMQEVTAREQAAGRSGELQFVTHSMGGLLLRSALALRNRHHPFDGIGRVVFIAPPFRGSLGTTFALVAGETDEWMGIGPAYRKITRGFPAVYQMTPSWPDAAVDEDEKPLDLFATDNWQANVVRGGSFRADLLRNAEAFVRGNVARLGGHSDAPMLDDAALAAAADKVLVVCASDLPTPDRLPVQSRNTANPCWFDFAHMHMDRLGDGRVLMRSAAVPGVPLAGFADCGVHALICRDERIIRLTSLWLDGDAACRLTPRTADDPVRRPRREFGPWDGRPESLETHVARVEAD